MQTGHGTGDLGGADAADLWVLDPVSGEYRMRLPGERPPPPRPAPPHQPPSAPSSHPQWQSPPPAQGGPTPSAPPQPGRAARRRGAAAPRGRGTPGRGNRGGADRGGQQHSGRWLAGVACFLLATGAVCGYVLLKGGSSSAAESGTASAASGCASPGAGAGGAPSAQAAVPLPEPAVSGSFLQGPKAAPVNIHVVVLNGTGTIGQAEVVLSWMQNDKLFRRASNGGPNPIVPTTTLVYAPDHVDQARTVAAAMQLPATALHGDGKTTGAGDSMVLTLGQDFHGIGKPFAAPSPAAPTGPATASATTGMTGKTGCGSQ
ncbi:LytR C-terminal domain-containing protein [Streptacidiphilus sp. EB129]|uniref:LytR C-terminal domain-containing protein n=1 Tax=Streptacidiphilus sp. EB129 TaxID=3156262 RepID=UPI0035183A96